jgi:hypothetical protein
VNVPVFPGEVVPRLAMDAGEGCPSEPAAPERLSVGITLFTAAVPLLVTVIVKVTICPIVTTELETPIEIESPPWPMVPTLEGVTVMGGTAAPVFESTPVALPVKEIDPTASAV